VTARRPLTAARLDRMPRPERVKAIWAALSPAGRERAWAALDDDQRVEALALLFDATEERPRERLTFAGAYDRWQREADR
jgi:hypothetical protein